MRWHSWLLNHWVLDNADAVFEAAASDLVTIIIVSVPYITCFSMDRHRRRDFEPWGHYQSNNPIGALAYLARRKMGEPVLWIVGALPCNTEGGEV